MSLLISAMGSSCCTQHLDQSFVPCDSRHDLNAPNALMRLAILTRKENSTVPFLREYAHNTTHTRWIEPDIREREYCQWQNAKRSSSLLMYIRHGTHTRTKTRFSQVCVSHNACTQMKKLTSVSTYTLHSIISDEEIDFRQYVYAATHAHR